MYYFIICTFLSYKLLGKLIEIVNNVATSTHKAADRVLEDNSEEFLGGSLFYITDILCLV